MTGRPETSRGRLVPLAIAIAALAVSPVAYALAGRDVAYPLALLPLAIVMWTATQLPFERVGVVTGRPAGYALAVLWPAAALAVLGGAAWATGGVRTGGIPARVLAETVLGTFTLTFAIGPFSTELFFRGWLRGALAERGYGTLARIAWTGVAFAFWQTGAALVIPALGIGWGALPLLAANMAAVGMALGAIREFSGSILATSVAWAVWSALAYSLTGAGPGRGLLTPAASALWDPERGAVSVVLNAALAIVLVALARRASTYECLEKRIA